ncbi:hypothetical protein LEP1GSC109_4546 [Leptospira interrogans str. UI 13372]|nr:hypothetical protein LEP1GSC109_4546 [Leptospira interrogans str. UI 13372]
MSGVILMRIGLLDINNGIYISCSILSLEIFPKTVQCKNYYNF